MASIGFDFATFYKWAVSNYLAGKLKGGKVNMAGLQEGIFVPFYGPKIDTDVRDAVERGTKAAIAGEIDFKAMFSGKF